MSTLHSFTHSPIYPFTKHYILIGQGFITKNHQIEAAGGQKNLKKYQKPELFEPKGTTLRWKRPIAAPPGKRPLLYVPSGSLLLKAKKQVFAAGSQPATIPLIEN
jgi:hypothetical protein